MYFELHFYLLQNISTCLVPSLIVVLIAYISVILIEEVCIVRYQKHLIYELYFHLSWSYSCLQVSCLNSLITRQIFSAIQPSNWTNIINLLLHAQQFFKEKLNFLSIVVYFGFIVLISFEQRKFWKYSWISFSVLKMYNVCRMSFSPLTSEGNGSYVITLIGSWLSMFFKATEGYNFLLSVEYTHSVFRI